ESPAHSGALPFIMDNPDNGCSERVTKRCDRSISAGISRALGNERRAEPTMNSDPPHSDPDDLTAAAPDATAAPDLTATQPAAGSDAATAPGFDRVDAIALEAVTTAVVPTQTRPDRELSAPSSQFPARPVPNWQLATGNLETPEAGEADPMVGRRVGPYQLEA